MKKYRLPLAVVALLAAALAVYAKPLIYKERGNAGRMVFGSGASLDIESGAEIDIESGGAFKVAGTDVTATISGASPRLDDHNTGISAFATGGQASATALTGRWNNVTTCATAGDSVKLLTAAPGQVQTVKNSGATTLAVFPNTSDAINALAVDLSVDVPPGAELTFRALDATTWETAEIGYFPAATTLTGGIEIQATASAGNFTTTLTNASMAAARTLTIPDPGGAASFVMTAGAQTIGGAKTFSSAPVFQAGPALPFLTGANNGTAGTNVTALEYGDGYNHVTVLTLTATELTPTIPANAEGAGAIIYTFPPGVYVAHSAHMDVTGAVMDTASNAAELGLGSVIAAGDVAVLSSPATFEDWVTGQVVADVSSIATEKSTIMTGGAPQVFEAGDSHVLNINIAGTWSATVTTASLTGTVTIHWIFLGS